MNNNLRRKVSEPSLPDYSALLQKGPRSRPLAKKILGLLLKDGKTLHGLFTKSTLKLLFPNVSEGKLKNLKSKVNSNVSLLERYNFIERVGRGSIKLKYRTPLCFIANTPKIPFAYIGLLGQRKYSVSETQTAIELLESDPNVGTKPEKVVVVTSQEMVGEWKNAINPRIKISWETPGEEELNDIDKVEELIRPIMVELMRDYILIMDLTSGPRPAGIAFYELAVQFKVPLIYVYEPKKRLRWLISKEKLQEEIGGVFCIQPEEKGPPITEIRKRPAIY
jgi:hypothetical protein